MYYDDVPQSFLFLESPGELLKVPMSSVTLDQLTQNLWKKDPNISIFKISLT